MHGFDRRSVEDIDLIERDGSLYVVVANKSCDEQVTAYYSFVEKAVKYGNRVVFISKEDGNKIFKPIATLMTALNSYDIYTTPLDMPLSLNYIEKVLERKPSFAEVQSYVGGDIVAFAEIDTILRGIKSLSDDGNVDALKDFMESHSMSIESMTIALNYMKTVFNLHESEQLSDKIVRITNELDKLRQEAKSRDEYVETVEKRLNSNTEVTNKLKAELETAKAANKELQAELDGASGSVIKSYKAINMASLKCTTKRVIYFKEISYVQYVNSLVSILVGILRDQKKLKVKFLIYDDASTIADKYRPIQTVSGEDYRSLKTNIINRTQDIVVIEPINNLLSDVLTSEQNFDVVVIYDRMRSSEDIVKGNMVTKFFIANSSSDIVRLRDKLGIGANANVITHTGSKLVPSKTGDSKESLAGALDVGAIPGFSRMTDTAKRAKYMRLSTSTEVLLIDTIFKRSNIETI